MGLGLFFFHLGAVNAMLDAVVLANCIYNMTEVAPSSITSVFEEYYKQRYPRLHFQFKRSQLMTSVMGGQVRDCRGNHGTARRDKG
jgi:2-polyprenyl-6-methoxyphenol hydroxylase-like FAD-dependent oxidoreductase